MQFRHNEILGNIQYLFSSNLTEPISKIHTLKMIWEISNLYPVTVHMQFWMFVQAAANLNYLVISKKLMSLYTDINWYLPVVPQPSYLILWTVTLHA